jgi:hypothetical protein
LIHGRCRRRHGRSNIVSSRRHSCRISSRNGSVGGSKRDGGDFVIESRARCEAEEDAGRDASGSRSNTRDGWKSRLEARDGTVDEAGGSVIVGGGIRSSSRKKLREEGARV